MLCFKKIEIDHWETISDQVYKFVLDTDILDKKHSWNHLDVDVFLKKIPQLVDSFDQHGLQISTAAIIYRRPFYQGGVHIDSGTGIRALIPVKNYHGSYTKFFEVKKNNYNVVQGKEQDKFVEIPNSAIIKEIASVESTTPFVFDPKIPHGVFTNPRCVFPRLTLTVGFSRSPVEFLNSTQ
jgi:hypothetical protein